MESEFLNWLSGRLGKHSVAPLGLSDDAAIFDLGQANRTVVTTDLLTEGVDFRRSDASPRRIGRKALAVNLSDLAAMAAQPIAAFVSLALPRNGALELAKELYEGLLPLAEEFRVAIAGGDTNTWDGGLVISVTAIGTVSPRGPLLRSGARAGDKILVTGDLGGSILGKHLDFQPRVSEALQLHDDYELHAGMDISDGLSLDLARLAHASGCGAAIDLRAVPISRDAIRLSERPGDRETPLDHALSDGEDFELLLAAPPEEAQRIVGDQPLGTRVTIIGEFVAQGGLWTNGPGAELKALSPRGYEH